jgi:acyl dehydratase
VGSVRTRLVCADARLEPRKRDVVGVLIGTALERDARLFWGVSFANQTFTFDMPAAEEPQLRAFLEHGARSAGRAT